MLTAVVDWACALGGGQVMIWDDSQSRCIGELSFRSEVYSVKLRRDKYVPPWSGAERRTVRRGGWGQQEEPRV